MRTGRMLFIGSLICRCRLVLGIPTSESHGLMAGMLGSGLALGTGGAVHWQDWQPVLAGLFLSLGLGFCWDGFYTVLQDLYFTNWEKSACPYGKKAGAAACAVMHGGQDGQKFAAMLGLAWQMAANLPSLGKQPSPIAAVLCAAAMGIGTCAADGGLFRKPQSRWSKLINPKGAAADLASAAALLVLSLLGLPVSTTHTKTASLAGCSAARCRKSVQLSVAGQMLSAWLLTFPLCGLLAWLLTHLLLTLSQ